MYSDIFFSIKNNNCQLTIYNIDQYNNITKKDLAKIYKCIKLLTYDLIALLNIFKYFYKQPEEDNQYYIYNNYLNKQHIFLHNYFSLLKKLKTSN